MPDRSDRRYNPAMEGEVAMRISFDLDDTLVCYREDVPQEPRLGWFLRLFMHDEPLRQGTPELIHQLRQRGWEIWVTPPPTAVPPPCAAGSVGTESASTG